MPQGPSLAAVVNRAADGPLPDQPRRGKVPGSGRKAGTPNKRKSYTAAAILEVVDPIMTLARIAKGEAFMLAPAPGEEPTLVFPTIRDVLDASKALAAKIAPDLKAVRVDDAGNLVTVMLNLAPSANVKVVNGAAPP